MFLSSCAYGLNELSNDRLMPAGGWYDRSCKAAFAPMALFCVCLCQCFPTVKTGNTFLVSRSEREGQRERKRGRGGPGVGGRVKASERVSE